MKKQKQADSKVVLFKPDMGYPDWYRFMDYCRSISCIAERLLWDRMKDADSDMVKAYKTTDEYQDLKKLVVIHQLPQTPPHNFKYRSLLYSDAFIYLWDYIRDKLKVTKLGIDMIQREYDKFLDEARIANQRRREQKEKLKTQLTKIGG